MTDLFENIYLRTAGAEKYDQLVAHEIPWTDQSVKDALTFMQDIVGESDNMVGGTEAALQMEMPCVGRECLQRPRKGRDGRHRRLRTRAGRVQPRAGDGLQRVHVPVDRTSSGPAVVGSGDLCVEFKTSPAADAFLEYLTTPDAAEIWASRGGFSSPNKNLDPSVYPDDITRTNASALAEAEDVPLRHASDLMPSAFGGTPGAGLFKAFTDFVQNPDDIDGITQQMETDANKAYGS